MNAAISTSSITHRPARQAGWNLIELMVVVSIITILLAILINTAVEGKGPIEQTKVILRGLNAVATEYEVSTTLKIDHFAPASVAGPPVVTFATPSPSIHRFNYAVWKLDKTRNMMLTLGKDAVGTVAGGAAPAVVNDAWGKAIRYYSGTGANIHNDTNVAGTLASNGMPTSKDPYFASAGPDGKWGTVDANNVPNTDARDNLYSNSLD